MPRFPEPHDQAFVLMDPDEAPEGDFRIIQSRSLRRPMKAVPISALPEEEWEVMRKQLLEKAGRGMSQGLSQSLWT